MIQIPSQFLTRFDACHMAYKGNYDIRTIVGSHFGLKNIVPFSSCWLKIIKTKFHFVLIIKKPVQSISDHAERLEELATTPEGLDLLA